jgi:hypothetical protein
MSRLTLSATLLLGLAAAAVSQTATISEIGLQGFYNLNSYNYGQPFSTVRVGVKLTNPHTAPVTLDLKLSVSQKDSRVRQEDEFTASVVLQPSEVRSLDLPVPVMFPNPVLALDVRTPDGQLVTHQTNSLEYLRHESLVLLLCLDDKTCNQILGAITSSGTEEDRTRKTKRYTFLVLKNPPEAWWIYGPAHSIILARSAAQLAANQRDALEGYLRQDGRLLLLDSAVGPGFLDPYRTAAPRGTLQNVGAGELLRFADSADIASFFNRAVREQPENGQDWAVTQFTKNGPYAGGLIYWPRNHFATVFEFPTLGWLIFWICAYILIVGPINFLVLTRIHRRDLAWITVPAIALAFALGIYLTSVAKRPSSIALDELGTYVMDDVQPRASATVEMRVSSPKPQDLTLVVPGDDVWNAGGRPLTPFAGFSVFDRETNFGDGWSVRLLPQRELSMRLLQWSFQDLTFSGIRTFPGNVRRLDGNHLANQTGLSFREAVLVENGFLYDLGAVGAGAVVNAHPGVPEDTGDHPTPQWNGVFSRARARDPLSHDGLKAYLAGMARTHKAAFAGLAEAPVLDASLPGHTSTHHQYVVVIVHFEDAP